MNYNKTIAAILVAYIVTLSTHSVKQINAAERVSDSSAQIVMPVSDSIKDENELKLKKLVITKILASQNSPLLPHADSFAEAAAKYDLDPYLLPSITWLESSLGKKLIASTHNPFGWGSGLIPWKSYDEGIEVVARGLRTNYINKGAKDVYDIGRIYAASPTWAVRVENFMNRFYNEEQSITNMRNVISATESG